MAAYGMRLMFMGDGLEASCIPQFASKNQLNKGDFEGEIGSSSDHGTCIK
jgi:hypothetical protein